MVNIVEESSESLSSMETNSDADVSTSGNRSDPLRPRVLRKYCSYDESTNSETTSRNVMNNKTRLVQQLSLIEERDHHTSLHKKNIYNVIATKCLNSLTNTQSGNGGGIPVGLSEVGNSAGGGPGLNSVSNGSHSNNGNGSDTPYDNGGVSSPESTGSPYTTIIPVTAIDRQSLKHLSVSAPAIRSAIRATGSDSEFTLAPSSSKSRQKKFHRHFTTVPQEEKVLDYYSCALVADILLQGYLYITENYFAFYSNVFGYVTKVLIPVCSVVRITKERTAKIIPNAVGVCSRSEKHVFASLISRDTTYKLMCRVWNYSIEQEAEEVLKLTNKLKDADKGSGDLSIPDESSGESGSGNDSTADPPGSYSPALVVDKLAKGIVGKVLVNPLILAQAAQPTIILPGHKTTPLHSSSTTTTTTVPTVVSTTGAYNRIAAHRTSIIQASSANSTNLTNLSKSKSQTVAGMSGGSKGPSLLILATALLVILFLSALLLLNRISNLQEKLSERPGLHDSDKFYQELVSWQNKLHSSSADEIHQYININLQQIIRVRQSLEALSLLFMSNQVDSPVISESSHHRHSKDP